MIRVSKPKNAAIAFTILCLLVATSAWVWVYYANNSVPQSISFYALIKNTSNETIQNGYITLDHTSDLLNFSNAKTYNSSDVQFDIHSDGYRVDIYQIYLEPEQSILIGLTGVYSNFTLNDPQFYNYRTIHPDSPKSFEITYVTQLLGSTPLGIVNLGSIFVFSNNGVIYTYDRNNVMPYALLTLLSLALLAFGTVLYFLKIYRGTRYPFVTLSIIAINSLTYAFIGSGSDVNIDPTLFLWKTPFMSVIFHGYYEHITGNFQYFILSALLLESWLDVKRTIRSFKDYYLMPFIISLLSAIVLGALNGFTSYSCGLSFVIELMAFSLWIMIIDSWGTLLDKKINAVFVLLSGIIMVPFINWIAKIVFYPASAYTLSTACMHIIIGAFGIAWFFIHFKIGHFKEEVTQEATPAPPAPPSAAPVCAS